MMAFVWLMAITATLGLMLGALGVALYAPVADLRRLAPRSRVRRLTLLAAGPWLLAAALCVFAFSPSLMFALGLSPDHCVVHHHQFHLCVVHAGSIGFLATALIAFTSACAMVRLGPRAWRMWRTQRRIDALMRLGRPSEGWTELDVRRPLAFTAGYFRPRVAVSTGLRDALTREELAIVLAHEHQHAERRDGLRRQLVELASIVHLPAVGRWICRELELACEQAADAAAAEAVGSRQRVAEVLLGMERLLGRHESVAVGFVDGELKSRVTVLLDEPDHQAENRTGVAVFALLILLAFAHLETMHHAVESFVALLI